MINRIQNLDLSMHFTLIKLYIVYWPRTAKLHLHVLMKEVTKLNSFMHFKAFAINFHVSIVNTYEINQMNA